MIKKYIVEILLILIWGLMIFIVNPLGEFPINDDWAYSKVVYHLIDEGKFQLGDWPAMTLVAQSLWGTLFCKIFGFSFNMLRISTILISIANTFLFYFFIKEITNNKNLAFFISLVWIFNPICFSLSFTFMTDIHFLFFSLLSLFFWYKYFKSGHIFNLIVGSFFSLAATFTRQQGIILPLALGIVLVLRGKKNVQNFIFSFAPFIVTLCSLMWYVSWLDENLNLPKSYGKIEDIGKFFSANDFSFFYSRLGLIFFNIGFLFLPATFFLIPYFKGGGIKKKIITIIIVSGIIIPAMITSWNSFPSGNTLYYTGLGPRLLKDTCHQENIFPIFSNEMWDAIRLGSLFSVIILIAFLSKNLSGTRDYFKNISSSPVRLIKLCTAILFIVYLGFAILNPVYFDRYCLPLILFLLIMVVPLRKRIFFKESMAGIILLIVFSFYSILLTHDFFSWNRARWAALNYLMKEKNIKPTQIDGGFEFNLWFDTVPPNWDESSGKSWYVTEDHFVISSGAIAGFQKIKNFPYQRTVPPGKDFIYVLTHKTR